MKTKRPNIALADVQLNTSMAKKAIERAALRVKECAKDSRHDERMKARECLWCFYHRSGGIVGHGFTDWTCRSCGGEHRHPNTGVPRICFDCSEEHGLCTRCGADLNLLHRVTL